MVLEGLFGVAWTLLEASLGAWGRSWELLEASWRLLEASWRLWEASWTLLEASWTLLEGSWRLFEALEVILYQFSPNMEPKWTQNGAKMEPK